MTPVERRYDIDWLRVISIGLLLIYHIGIVFQPWGVFLGFLQSDQPLSYLWPAMSNLNVWRIPLLFLVSGMGVCFAIRKRDWKQLILERSRRIFLPFLFGMLIIVPVHIFIWQRYYKQEVTYTPGPGHLWFLGNIFLYVILLMPLFFYLKRNENGRLVNSIRHLFGHPLGLLVLPVAILIETLLIRPEIYALYAMTLHGFLLGLLVFLAGFLMVVSGNRFWNMVLKWRWSSLSVAVALYLIRLLLFHLEAPNWMLPFETCMWIYAVLGFGYRYLNHPGKTLSYLSQGAYPIYILHMIFLFLGASVILRLGIPTITQFLLLVVFTITGCFATYELIIRRVRFLRPLFGLKPTGRVVKSGLRPTLGKHRVDPV
jgi:peptidoglycan/LPS O-acetylase OafA/YrhL